MGENMTSQAIEAVAALTRQTTEAQPHPKGGVFVRLPSGAIQHLEPIDPPLTNVKQKVKMLDAESFIHYVNRFKAPGEKTTIFAEYAAPAIKGCIDYHDKDKADYLHHEVNFAPPWSEQWARWRGIDGKITGQIEFAEFVEENIGDIVDPDGAAFLDVVTGLQAKKKVNFESGIRLQDGSNQLTYNEEIEGKGRNALTVPSEFAVGAPIFFGGAPYKVRCLLRYRINEGKLVFVVKINRRLFVEQTAFADITKEIAEKTGLTVLSGSV